MLKSTIILASSSPRRQQMLGWAGLTFDVQPAWIDETALADEVPDKYVLRVAGLKAEASLAGQNNGQLALAADTIVADGEHLLGKPADRQEAGIMLRSLRGRSHQVYTALVLFDGQKMLTDLCISQVPMREYTDEEIDAYVASGDPLDKAGAYAIQHPGFRPVVDFSGCFASVTGMPLCHLLRTLKKVGITQDVMPQPICLEHFGYNCPIFVQVLAGENVG